MKTYINSVLLTISVLFVVILSFHACKSSLDTYEINKYFVAEHAGISTAHPEATRIGVEILQSGGNAIDAAIAVQFALSVCYPIAGNIGGGGFMVYRDVRGNIKTLDFREKAPIASSETMYQDSIGNIVKGLSTSGSLAVGVPGTVDGMVKMYNTYSSLQNWEALVQPSIDMAKNGFRLTENQAKNLNKSVDAFRKNNPTYDNPFTHAETYVAGELFVQKDLAMTLEAIRDRGRAGFYEGAFAQKLIRGMEESGGIIAAEDLRAYESQWRDPIAFHYKDYTIYSMGPPSSGGIILAQLFQAVAKYPIKEWGFHSVKSIHLMVEAEKRAFADRASHMGDTDFYPVPVDSLISAAYIMRRMYDFSMDQASKPSDIRAGDFYESEETTHFSIVDSMGNAVSITTTLNGAYGSKVVVPGAGYILNNEMDDFSSKVGVPNMYGLVGAEANKIEPGKRMLSSMTPTIVTKGDSLFMVVGTPGGSTIITSVFQTILNAIEYDMNAGECVVSPRFHHQWKPEEVLYESESFSSLLIDSLVNMGHIMKERDPIGRVEAIIHRNGKLEVAADTRGDDHVDGY